MPHPDSMPSTAMQESGASAICLNVLVGPPTSTRYRESTRKSPAAGTWRVWPWRSWEAKKVSRRVPMSVRGARAWARLGSPQ